MQKIHVLTNPLSGKNRKRPSMFDNMMLDATKQSAPHIELTVHKPRGLDALLESIQTVYDKRADVLCIHGGDGTVHQTFTALWKVYGEHTPYPHIAILKGGTMNNIARNVGVSFWSSAQSLLRDLVSDKPMQVCTRHPLIIDESQSGFIYGNAALAPFLEDYYTGRPPSPAKGFWMFCKTTWSAIFNTAYSQRILKPVPMNISIDGESVPNNAYTMLGLSTVADLGFYFRPFYNTFVDPSSLQLIAMTCSPLHIVKVLPQLWLAKPTRKNYILDRVGKEIHFEYDSPQVITIDGDVYPPKSSETIRVGPAVQFLHP